MCELFLWSGPFVLICVKTPAVRPIVFAGLKIHSGKVECTNMWPDQSVPTKHIFYSDTLG